ncbi:GAF domain-containing protein [Streptomyces sp. NP-1717]|uniref:GAF domain-containing protein n=1 Tax=unclassified Streptomyces TaxID=2593676 RepID=UPI001F5D2A00|nr:GAF domain-containing protein [Streptomyces sp. NP-1717]MCI3223344.1 GAF domain-containing protein [Streptomyces sp. NP-1717]WTA73993.1 GAF domain-containing protein [Streptomyces sp. NBC_00838]
MTYDTEAGLHLPAPDRELAHREARLRELGLGDMPDAEFDAFATQLAQAAGAPYAMVNFITGHQFFAGLHTPSAAQSGPGGPEAGGNPEVSRIMSRDHGYCPDVLNRRKALVLPDVYAYPRFASNEVVDLIGIRTYAGAPLIDERTDTVLGTVCFVGTDPRGKETGRDTLQLIKESRDQLMRLIYQRTGGGPRQ